MKILLQVFLRQFLFFGGFSIEKLPVKWYKL